MTEHSRDRVAASAEPASGAPSPGRPVAAPDWCALLVRREAHLLDHRLWDDWLALYDEQAVFWVPAWIDDETPGDDPDRQVSLIYCTARAGLADRVWRLRSGLSVASTPLPRTTHLIGEPLCVGRAGDDVDVAAGFSCHVWSVRARRQHVFFGQTRWRLRAGAEGGRIMTKTVHLHNDRIPTALDFYCV